MEMYDCPKFEQCSAAVCPLYKSVAEQSHLPNDRTCFYLTEAQKIDSKAIFMASGLGELHEVMAQATIEAFSNPATSNYLVKNLKKAALTSSSIAKGRNAKRIFMESKHPTVQSE